jgi:hypothetical protein
MFALSWPLFLFVNGTIQRKELVDVVDGDLIFHVLLDDEVVGSVA